ncbi:MAG: hypothetical protein ABSB09_14190 [Acidimicrobiales bacterium]|jgi:hypothetical protein
MIGRRLIGPGPEGLGIARRVRLPLGFVDHLVRNDGIVGWSRDIVAAPFVGTTG